MTFLTRQMVILQGKKNNCWVARKSRFNTKHEQVCVGVKTIKWSMITQIIEARKVFLIMNSIDILEEVKMLTMITTHLSRGFLKM